MEATYKRASKITESGMFTFVQWNRIFIAPPLNIHKAEMHEGLQILSQAMYVAASCCH